MAAGGSERGEPMTVNNVDKLVVRHAVPDVLVPEIALSEKRLSANTPIQMHENGMRIC